MIVFFTVCAVLFLSFSNGANDNFKGVATLLGSKTTNFKMAIVWASITTFSGSLLALFFAEKLLVNYSGKGLISDHIITLSAFPISLALAAAITVFLATKFGFPISTTHALTGGLIGIGLVDKTNAINLSKLYSVFFLPLLISPLLSILLAILFYKFFNIVKKRYKISKDNCICFEENAYSLGNNETCKESKSEESTRFKMNIKSFIDLSHFISAGAVGFARGLNDTPKIAAILLIGKNFNPQLSLTIVGLLILTGGILYSKKVAEKMSYEITVMSDGQGLTANIVTSIITLFASGLAIPVSTTHVSCGALFGIGVISKKARWNSIFKIVLSWIITLPLAIVLGHLIFKFFIGVL